MKKYSNRAFQGAYNKGAAAFDEGKTVIQNPYGDARTWRGSITFARAFHKVWNYGFRDRKCETEGNNK